MNRKKFIGVFFFALIVFSMFGFLSASGEGSSELFNSLSSNQLLKPIFSLFGFTSSEGFATFLLATLVIMMVYSLMSFLPFFGDGPGIKWAASIIIGILAFFYVDINRVRAILIAYESLGFVFSAVIPFLIVFAFTVKIETDKRYQGKNAVFGYLISNGVLWGFLLYILYNALFVDNGKYIIWFWILALVLVVWLFLKRKILGNAISNTADKAIKAYQLKAKKSNAVVNTNAETVDNL